jgi:methionyl aminopeptidase
MPHFQILTPAQIKSLRTAGKILRECLEATANYAKAGMTTKEIDEFAEEFIRSRGGIPAFKGYNGFTGTLCTSVNEECVHGIPGPKVLNNGDIIGLDGGVIYDKLYTDACITVPIGEVPFETIRFLEVSKAALEAAVSIVKPGTKIGDISSMIQAVVEGGGYRCVNALTGHGLGSELHQFPDIPNTGTKGTGPTLPAWTLIAIEPITSMGGPGIRELEDGWTIVTADGSLSAHFEHSVLVTEDGCEVLA